MGLLFMFISISAPKAFAELINPNVNNPDL